MEITLYVTLTWLISVIILGVCLFILFTGERSRSVYIFLILLILTAIWSISVSINIPVNSTLSNAVAVSSFFIKLGYFLGIVISTVFVFFSISYPYNQNVHINIIYILLPIVLMISYLILGTNLVITNTVVSPLSYNYIWNYGKYWYIFDLYFSTCWFIGFTLIVKKLIVSKDNLIKNQLKLLLASFIIGVFPPAIFTIILPRIGIYNYDGLGPLSGLVWVLIIAYAISKHHLFNMKIIAIEFVVFTLWIFIFIRILLADSVRGIIIESSILLILIVFGILLIQNVLNGIKQRKKIEELNNELREAYSHIREMNLVNDLDLDRK